jgi:protein involved in temperature-dependent protein secretion
MDAIECVPMDAQDGYLSAVGIAVQASAEPMRLYGEALDAAIDALAMEKEQFSSIANNVMVIRTKAAAAVEGEPPSLVLKQRLVQLLHLMGDDQLAGLDRNTFSAIERKNVAFRKLYPTKSLLMMASGMVTATRNSPPLGQASEETPAPAPANTVDATLDTPPKGDKQD